VGLEEHKQRARAVFDAIERADPKAMRALVTDDLVWVIPRSAPAPYAGRHEGAERVLELMFGAVAAFAPGSQKFHELAAAAEGDVVFVETNLRARGADGRDYDNHYCFVFAFRDGRIREIREHVDTSYAASFFAPKAADPGEEALAHCRIESLLSLYYQALDRGDLATLESSVMAEDAVWDLTQLARSGRVRDRLEGRDAILAWFRKMLSGGVTMGEHGVRHFLNTHVIAVDGARARSTSHLQCVHTETMATLAVGRAEAEHVETPQGWRIRSYTLEERITDEDMRALQETFGRASA
jgi:hypothetical protein